MLEPPYRALRILLGLFSLLAALGGLLLIFADRTALRTADRNRRICAFVLDGSSLDLFDWRTGPLTVQK